MVMIGGAMLLFVLDPTMLDSLFSGNPSEIGEIAGNTVDGRKFQEQVDVTVANYKTQTGQTTIDPSTEDQLREQTWNQMVREIVFGDELEAAGIRVSDEELYDLVQGNNPHPQVVQAFTNRETGQFDRAQISQFFSRMEEDEQLKSQWIEFESSIADIRKSEKYNNLIKKGLYITKAEAESDFVAKNETASIKYVLKRYKTVADSTIKVTDADIKAYYNKNKDKYEQDASRDVEFVSFQVTPSKEDYEKVRLWSEDIKADFETAKNDTQLVNAESDVRFNARWLASGELGGDIDTLMFQAEKGFVYGPYLEGQTYRLAKLIGVKMAPDSVNARHILISPESAGGIAQAKAIADSLKALIENGGDFAALATQNSADPGSGAKGGDLGWFKEGQMVPTFNDACFDGDEGDVVMVQSRFGYHIIEVIEQAGSTEKRAVAFIDRRVDASTKTFQTIFGEADDFARSITSMASFDQEVANRGLNKRIASNLKEGDKTIAGLENPRPLIRWAFDAEKEDVSEVFELGNSFVIGVLTSVREEGFTAMDEIKDELEAGAIQEKKAKQFIADLEAAKAGDIQSIADNANLPLEVKSGVSFSANAIQGLGREPALLGAVAGMKAGSISAPIKGEQGVYIVYLESKSEAPAQTDFTVNKTSLNSSLSSRVDYEVYEALKEKADITDNRSKFF